MSPQDAAGQRPSATGRPSDQRRPIEGQEIGREAGTSPARERRWGVIGGTLGALYGSGSALIGIFVEGAPW